RTGNYPETFTSSPAGEWDLFQFGHRNAAGDSRHHSRFDVVGFVLEYFFVSPAENRGVSPFEPYHVTIVKCKVYNQIVDLPLGIGMVSGPFPNENLFCTSRSKTKKIFTDQRVVEHHVCRCQ